MVQMDLSYLQLKSGERQTTIRELTLGNYCSSSPFIFKHEKHTSLRFGANNNFEYVFNFFFSFNRLDLPPYERLEKLNNFDFIIMLHALLQVS